MIWFLLVPAAYQALALLAALRHLVKREPEARELPPVSILKPVRGLDPHFYDAIRSHAVQDYPEFEILFAARDPADPALKQVERLQQEFPRVRIRAIASTREAANGKVGLLADLAAAARHPILLVNDSDIAAQPGYLRRVAAPLADPRVGMVTCLYRAEADRWPGRFEAVGIATDFAPSVLVARLVGVSEFALGSTMAFRARDLERVGGFPAIADYLADDYQLSRRIRGLGLEIAMSKVPVVTHLPDAGWSGVWRHQARWARTIRASRRGGYLGMPVTNATLWALLAAAVGWWGPAAALIALRAAAGLVVSRAVLGSPHPAATLALMPTRDLYGFAVWVAGLFGRTVVWRGQEIVIDRDGRIR